MHDTTHMIYDQIYYRNVYVTFCGIARFRHGKNTIHQKTKNFRNTSCL